MIGLSHSTLLIRRFIVAYISSTTPSGWAGNVLINLWRHRPETANQGRRPVNDMQVVENETVCFYCSVSVSLHRWRAASTRSLWRNVARSSHRDSQMARVWPIAPITGGLFRPLRTSNKKSEKSSPFVCVYPSVRRVSVSVRVVFTVQCQVDEHPLVRERKRKLRGNLKKGEDNQRH